MTNTRKTSWNFTASGSRQWSLDRAIWSPLESRRGTTSRRLFDTCRCDREPSASRWLGFLMFSHFKLRYPSEFPLFTSVHLLGMYNDVYIYKNVWSLARWAKLKHVFLTFSILFCLFGGWHSLLPVERHYLKRCRARCILSSDCAFAKLRLSMDFEVKIMMSHDPEGGNGNGCAA